MRVAYFGPAGGLLEELKEMFRDVYTLEDDVRLGDADNGARLLESGGVTADMAVISGEIAGDLEALAAAAVERCVKVFLVGGGDVGIGGVERIEEAGLADALVPFRQDGGLEVGRVAPRHEKEKTAAGRSGPATPVLEIGELAALERELYVPAPVPKVGRAERKEEEAPRPPKARDLLALLADESAAAHPAAGAHPELEESEDIADVVGMGRRGVPWRIPFVGRPRRRRLGVAPVFENSKVIAVYGAGEGVGTTTLALNLGATLSVACVWSGDHIRPRVLFLGLAPSAPGGAGGNVSALLESGDGADIRSFSEYRPEAGMFVLEGPRGESAAGSVTGEQARRLLSVARAFYDLVVVDCGADARRRSAAAALATADMVVVVTESGRGRFAAAEGALESLWELREESGNGVAFVENRSPKRKRAVIPGGKCEMLGPVPDSRVFAACGRRGDLAVLGDYTIKRALMDISENLIRSLNVGKEV